MKWLWLAYLVVSPASAETIQVRTGEHADFSRVVLAPTRPTAWDLVRTEEGYRIKFARSDIDFDLKSAFALIPRDRIQQISLGSEAASLNFVLHAGVIAQSFETEAGAVVIDFASGVAEPLPEAIPMHRKPLSSLARSDPISTQFYWRGIAQEPNETETQSLAPLPPATAPSYPREDTRVGEAEKQLLTQLSRAASQGLVRIDRPKLIPQHDNTADIKQEPLLAPIGAESSAAPDDPLAYQMQTAIDRELAPHADGSSFTATGKTCLADDDFDLGHWLTEDAPAVQIADARRKLLGEFDRPNQDDVVGLAKLYLALSFGAESKAVLEAFGAETEDKGTLLYLAQVLDNLPVDGMSPILDMTECDTAAALWALLGSQEPQKDHQINFAAVQRAYSGLPHTLRLALADRLIEALILNNAQGVARMIRNIAARIEPEGTSLGMADARLDLAHGDTAIAEKGLETVVAQDGNDAVDALLLLVETQFGNGDVTDPKIVENVAALAFEHRFAEDGAQLARAYILASAAAGLYPRAIAALRNWPSDNAPAKAKVVREVYDHIVRHADDNAFLKSVFEHPDLWQTQMATLDTRTRAAARFLALGFPDPVLDLVEADISEGEEIAALVADAYLLQQDGTNALRAVQGLKGSATEQIRARAFAILGQGAASTDAFIASGDTENARRQAWKAGAWDVTAQIGSREQKTALSSLKLVPEMPLSTSEPPGAGAVVGPIAQSQNLIDESARLRAALKALMATTD